MLFRSDSSQFKLTNETPAVLAKSSASSSDEQTIEPARLRGFGDPVALSRSDAL